MLKILKNSRKYQNYIRTFPKNSEANNHPPGFEEEQFPGFEIRSSSGGQLVGLETR